MAVGTSFLQTWRRRALLLIAGAWRRAMFRTKFIAVTGSVGKTSCKEAIAEILATRFSIVRTRGSSNHFKGVTRTILRVRPWHRYAVIEIGLDRPGQMAAFARAVCPDIAVWVSVARTHTMNFRSLATTAQEKSQLIEGLRPAGIAILNDDDPYISRYRPPSHVRAIYYGVTERSELVPSEVSSRWPQRLSFTASARDEQSVRVATQFVGEHWIASIVPALIVGRECGIPLKDAAAAIRKHDPMAKRLSPVELPNGAIILRDERNGSVDTLAAALKVLADATATRKMIVFTDVSDSSQKPRNRVRDLGKAAARIADAAIFLGEYCEHGARAAVAGGMAADQVWFFYNIEDAAARLRTELRAGDLVLLRGRRIDHLARLYLSLVQDVTCWRNRCYKQVNCEDCRLLTRRKTPLSGLSLSGARSTKVV